MTKELYTGQVEIVAGKLAEAESYQEADREKLKYLTDPKEREAVLRRIAGREGNIAHRRRFLAELLGEPVDGAREKVVRLRLTAEEYAKVTSAAEESGQTLSQYIRDRLF